jgi:hypothetical protein
METTEPVKPGSGCGRQISIQGDPAVCGIRFRQPGKPFKDHCFLQACLS